MAHAEHILLFPYCMVGMALIWPAAFCWLAWVAHQTNKKEGS